MLLESEDDIMTFSGNDLRNVDIAPKRDDDKLRCHGSSEWKSNGLRNDARPRS